MNPLAAAVLGTLSSVFGMAMAAVAFAAEPAAAPWLSYGGSSVAVGGLVFVLKKLLDGSLVPQPVAKLIEESQRRDRDVMTMAQEILDVTRAGQVREDRMWDRLGPGRTDV